MKGFLEVTNIDTYMNVLIPLSKISSVVCDVDGSVFIEMSTNDGSSSGILVVENYDEIKQKIKLCEV